MDIRHGACQSPALHPLSVYPGTPAQTAGPRWEGRGGQAGAGADGVPSSALEVSDQELRVQVKVSGPHSCSPYLVFKGRLQCISRKKFSSI